MKKGKGNGKQQLYFIPLGGLKMTQKMTDALHKLCLADHHTPGNGIDIHARTAWALHKLGYVMVDGAAELRHWMNGNYVFCLLPERQGQTDPK